MASQTDSNPAHFLLVLLVPEEMKGHLGTGIVPAADVLAETGVHHISVKIIPFRSLTRQDIPPQQRRNHTDMLFFIVLHLTERKGEFFAGTHTRETREETEHPQAEAILVGKFKVTMQKEILMAYADLGHGRPEQKISQPREQFVEVDDQFGTALLNAAAYIVHAFQVDGQTGEIIGHTARKTCPLIGRCRQEIGTEKTFHRSLDAAVEETGQTARIAFAHQHFHYFVTVAAQQLFHCNGLGQMPAAFSLNDKKDFHWDDLMIYKLLLKHM